jgi:predicted O-methyltransferase YrrM
MQPSELPNACTLDTPRVTKVLTRLAAELESDKARRQEVFGDRSPAERARAGSDDLSDYHELYGRAKDLYLAVSADTARLLYMLARGIGARTIVEFGTSFGVSTLYLAAALRDNGGGKVIGTELEPTKADRAHENLAEAGLDDLVDIRVGDAVETLARDLPDPVDLVLLDGHKPLYPKILDLLAPRIRAGGYLVADNAGSSPEYLARVRSTNEGYLSVPFAGDVELTMKV